MDIRSAKKSKTPSPTVILPDDLIAEVFSFLPVKSLLQFRCISKYWKTLVFEPSFVKLHRHRSASRNPQFTLVTQHLTHIAGYYDDDEIEYSVVPYSLNRLIQNPSVTLSVDPYYLVRTTHDCSSLIGTCNGLICLAYDYGKVGYFRLWNPATRTTSPKFGYFSSFPNPTDHRIPFIDMNYIFTFGCDISTDTYKIVASHGVTASNMRILSLSDNVWTWRDIGSFPADPILLDSDGEDNLYDAVYIRSTFNWLAITKDFHYNVEEDKDVSVQQFVIVSLDLGTEKFSQYCLPCDFEEVPPTPPTVSVLGGFLCSCFYKETDFVIWQMKELGVEDSWTQFLKISYQNLQIHYDYSMVLRSDEESEGEEISDVERKYHFQLVPVLLSEDGDTLVLKSDEESHAILYNWRYNRVERTKIATSSTINDNRTIGNSIFWGSTMVYVESLVSIF